MWLSGQGLVFKEILTLTSFTEEYFKALSHFMNLYRCQNLAPKFYNIKKDKYLKLDGMPLM